MSKTLLTEKETLTLAAIAAPPILLVTLVTNKVSLPNAIAIVIFFTVFIAVIAKNKSSKSVAKIVRKRDDDDRDFDALPRNPNPFNPSPEYRAAREFDAMMEKRRKKEDYSDVNRYLN